MEQITYERQLTCKRAIDCESICTNDGKPAAAINTVPMSLVRGISAANVLNLAQEHRTHVYPTLPQGLSQVVVDSKTGHSRMHMD